MSSGLDLHRFSSELSLAELQSLILEYRTAQRVSFKRTLRVGLLANHSTQFLSQGLEVALASRSIEGKIFEAGFDQWEKELLDPQSDLAQSSPEVVILSLTSQSLFFQSGSTHIDQLTQKITSPIQNFLKRNSTRFVFVLPEPLEEEISSSSGAATFRKKLQQQIQSELQDSVLFLDLEPLIRKWGSTQWYSSRFFVSAKMMCHPDRVSALADYLSQFVVSAIERPVKLVVVDLDDTLWGGIVGEIGWEKVNLDYRSGGLPHLRLQRFLLGLFEKGVLLAVVSKNTERNALEVFENRPEMLLKLGNFAEMRINWNPKSQNLSEILKNLNLSTSGVVFLDDHPQEREEIRQRFPEVFVPDFPSDLSDLVPSLEKSGKFVVARSTSEDLKRQEFYQLEKQRKKSQPQSGDLSDYYRSLELTLEVSEVDASNQDRVLDLISKTNQFNLTTRRHGLDELKRFVDPDEAYAFTFRLKDRFGDYGWVGVLLAEPSENTTASKRTLKIDTWLLSCRAMGRTVENAMFAHLVNWANVRDFDHLLGEWIQTAKNSPVKDLLPKLGFSDGKSETSGHYIYDLKKDRPINEFVNLKNLSK